jgi:hypothetical protein
MAEKKLTDQIKKIDLSDMKILGAGIVLLIIPIVVLMVMSGSNKGRKMSAERMKTMVNRKQIFNFNRPAQKGGKAASSTGGKKAGTGWFADTPEKKVQIELEEAFRVVQRSRRSERFPPGMTQNQKQAYRAETNPLICSGNGAMEQGDLHAAEKFFEQAMDESGDNVFQKVHALGGLCEVYTRMGDKQKAEQAFKLFMDWVAKLPPEMGGGNLSDAVRNAYMGLKSLKNSADPGKVAQQLDKEELMRRSGLSQSEVSRGLSKTLVDFPAKFD